MFSNPASGIIKLLYCSSVNSVSVVIPKLGLYVVATYFVSVITLL